MNTKEAYLCSTGREFPHDGTVNPLYVKYNSGSLSFEKALEDIFYLTALPFTRPEDCSRYPLSIRITDRRLSEEADEYDQENLELMLTELNISAE